MIEALPTASHNAKPAVHELTVECQDHSLANAESNGKRKREGEVITHDVNVLGQDGCCL